MLLGIFVTENEHGATEILGYSFMCHEDTDTFIFIFEAFKVKILLGHNPAIIMTDGSAAMEAAIKVVFNTSDENFDDLLINNTNNDEDDINAYSHNNSNDNNNNSNDDNNNNSNDDNNNNSNDDNSNNSNDDNNNTNATIINNNNSINCDTTATSGTASITITNNIYDELRDTTPTTSSSSSSSHHCHHHQQQQQHHHKH